MQNPIYSRIANFNYFAFTSFILLTFFSSGLYANTLKEINLGILSLSPPLKTYKNWKPFAEYLSREMAVPVRVVAPRGFGKLKKMAEKKEIDLFYVNSHIFYLLKQADKAVAIAQMENIADSTTSQSSIFVRSDSKIDNISQLKGKTFAFVSPMGAGGYLAPRAFLYQHGLKTQEETTELFTKNLTNSIYDVLLGKADAATMCGVNYQLMGNKIDTGELKVIASSGNYPENVLASRADLSKDVINQLQSIVTSMPDSAEGRDVLKAMQKMKIKQFITYDPEIENLTQSLLKSGEFSVQTAH